MIDLDCPRCHKHHFKVGSFLLLRMSSSENPVFCPYCGTPLTLTSKSGNVINLITFGAFFGYLVLAIPLTPKGIGVYVMAVGGVVVSATVRWLAVRRFGKIEVYISKRARDSMPRIRLADVGAEVERLKDARDFFVLFTPDEEAYISFGRTKGVIKADLAFAIGKFEELEPKFREAVARAGTTAHPYRKNRLRGIEADLGTDVQSAAMKINTIMQETFGLKPDAEVPVMRQN